jgi:DHA2 family multidrug resistance protein
VKLPVLESFGVALFLTPGSVLAYSQLKSGKNDAAASLYGMFRNHGSAIGISVVNTMLVRRVQIHHTYLAANLTHNSLPLAENLNTAVSWLELNGGSSLKDTAFRARGFLNGQLNQQAVLLSYSDCFRLLMWVSLCCVPIAIFFAVKNHGP